MSKTHSKENLFLAYDASGNYANAFILNYWLITAGHVAFNGILISDSNAKEQGNFNFLHHPIRDIARSEFSVQGKGFEILVAPSIGEKVYVVGHHGRRKQRFTIEAEVEGYDRVGRFILKRTKGKSFQLGMSGSVALDRNGRAFGTLVKEAEGSKDGEKCVFEPVSSISEI